MAKSIVSPKTYLTYSLGCRTNQAEMENISLQLTAYGLRQFKPSAPPFSPDLILLNTCVVTQKAERETRKEIRKLQRLYPKSFLAILGCAVTAKQKSTINLPEADLLIPNEYKDRVIELLEQKYGSFPKINQQVTIANRYIQSGRKLIKIQEGCDRFCSFCLTAYLRGTPKSVSPGKIIEEINFWEQKGIKEIILTGINLSLYGQDLKPPKNISNLIKEIWEKTSVERISLSSIDPEMLTDDFLKIVIGNPRITQCFHLSLQSGSPTVLERMNRKTNLEELLKKLKFIKTKNPFFTFRADIITGFPNETEKEFKETSEFIKKAKIPFIHVFPFSARQGTKAYEMIKRKKWPDLPTVTKKERVGVITKAIEQTRRQEATKQFGEITDCLMVRLTRNNLWEGLIENGWLVKIKDQKSNLKNAKGKIFPIKIIDFKEDQLWGEILSLPV